MIFTAGGGWGGPSNGNTKRTYPTKILPARIGNLVLLFVLVYYFDYVGFGLLYIYIYINKFYI